MDGRASCLRCRLTGPVQRCCTIHAGTITRIADTTKSQSNGAACIQTTAITTTMLDR